MDKNCISALIAVKTIEALYGKVLYPFVNNDGSVESKWDFSSCDFDSDTIEEREEILQNLDSNIVEIELQTRYNAYRSSSDEFSISNTELSEIVMWAGNGFITFSH